MPTSGLCATASALAWPPRAAVPCWLLVAPKDASASACKGFICTVDTIKSGTDISALFSQGRRFHATGLTLIVLPTSDRSSTGNGRVAFIAGKKSGNAVWRNAAKRRMRAICRECGGPWNQWDVLFLAKKPLLDQPYAKVKQDTVQLVRRAALAEPPAPTRQPEYNTAVSASSLQ